MAWVKDDACFGCAECIGCGRRFQKIEYCVCDRCGDQIESIGFDYNGEELCAYCAAEQFLIDNVHPELMAAKKDMIDAAGYDLNDIEALYEYFETPKEKQYPVFSVDNRYDYFEEDRYDY